MTPPRAAWRVKRPLAHPEKPKLEGLVEEGTDAFPVRITIVQDDVVTGWDDGALGFEEDAVWFSGLATSFRLAAPDVRPGAYLLSRREAVTNGEALNQGFPLRHDSRDIWVRVQVLSGDKEDKAELETRLVAGVRRLRALGESRIRSEYPPLSPRPGLLRSSAAHEKDKKQRVWMAGALIGIFGVLKVLGHLRGKSFEVIDALFTGTIMSVLLRFQDSEGASQRILYRIAREEEERASDLMDARVLPLTTNASSFTQENRA